MIETILTFIIPIITIAIVIIIAIVITIAIVIIIAIVITIAITIVLIIHCVAESHLRNHGPSIERRSWCGYSATTLTLT